MKDDDVVRFEGVPGVHGISQEQREVLTESAGRVYVDLNQQVQCDES